MLGSLSSRRHTCGVEMREFYYKMVSVKQKWEAQIPYVGRAVNADWSGTGFKGVIVVRR